MRIRVIPKPVDEDKKYSGLPTTIPTEQKEEKSTNDGNTPTYTAPTYDNTAWEETEKGKAAWSAYQDALSAVTGHGDFKYANKAQLDSIMRSILNREKFSYDFNEDAFYHQYKDKYIKQGKMAAADVMGQAAAMTGGYGNSYAATVGNQAYQASLEQLNDIVPELYQMAYDRYNQEGQDLYNQYSMLADDYARGYAKHQDKYDRLVDALGVARSDYYDGGDAYRAEQSSFNDAVASVITPTGTTPSIDAKTYIEILSNAEIVAEQGAEALANYVNGLEARGLSPEEAANIYEQYFPTIVGGGGAGVMPKVTTSDFYATSR